MRTQEALDIYGTQQAIADALGITQSSVGEWGEYPPRLRQLQLAAMHPRKLKPEPDCFPQKAKAA